MSRKIDIELTSDRGDGTWTWRAAGAKQPKGVVSASLLPGDATVGQQLRAEVETSLDGTDVLSVSSPKAKNRAAVETIELLPRGGDEPLVTQTLVGRKGGGRRDRDGDRRDRGDRGPRGDRRDGGGRGGPRRDGDRAGRGGERGEGRGRPDGDRGPRGERGARGDRPDRPRRERPAPPPKPKAKRLRPGRAHRKVALEALSPEEQVIGELLLAGGIPAVRQAIEKQNEQAKAEGTPAASAAPLLVIAERLWPALRVADWRDKAEAALADLAELDLKDLRSVVVASDAVAKDPETAELAAQLREGLTSRLDAEQTAWLDELRQTLKEGRIVRALRLSSRPPKAGAPLPPEIAGPLAEQAAAALAADVLVDRWATVLDALSFSPVRLTVAPASKPEEPSAELVAVITRFADRTPKVAEAFGIEPSAAPARRGRGGRGGRGGAPRPPKAGAAPSATTKPKPVPPPPPLPAAPAPAAEGAAEPVVARVEEPVAERAEEPVVEAPAGPVAPADPADDGTAPQPD